MGEHKGFVSRNRQVNLLLEEVAWQKAADAQTEEPNISKDGLCMMM